MKKKYKASHPGKKEIQAKCPMCDRLHLVNIYWTGNGVPRIYCNRHGISSVVQDGKKTAKEADT